MGYFEKQRKRLEAEKQLKAIMNTQAYRDMQKQLNEQVMLEAEAKLSVVACDYFELKHNYKSRGFKNFLLFAAKRFKYSTDENQQYLSEMNEYWIAEHGFDMLEFIGLAIKTDDEKRTCQCGKVIHVDNYKFCPYCGEELKGVELNG